MISSQQSSSLIFERKALQWKSKCQELSSILGLSHSSSASLLIDDENKSSLINVKKIPISLKPFANSIKHEIVRPFQESVVGNGNCSILKVMKATPNITDVHSNSYFKYYSYPQLNDLKESSSIQNNNIKLSWIFQQLTVLSNTQFHLTNPLKIKSIIQNTQCIAYKYEEQFQQYGYIVQLYEYDKNLVKYYLSIIISYTYDYNLQYHLPQITCFLSKQQPNIYQILLSIQIQQQIKIQKIFSKLNLEKYLTSLYQFFKYTCGLCFLDDLILDIMLEKSILIKGKSNKYISELIYLITHYSGVQLCHRVSYQIMDIELLDLPTPYIFGTSHASILNTKHKQNIYIIDLDLLCFENIPEINWNLNLKFFVSQMKRFVDRIPKEFDLFDIIRVINSYFEDKSVGLYMLEYVKTMGFREYLESHRKERNKK